MSHEVESMAYTNELPWHGLGFKVDNKQTVDGMLKAAKLNWSVEKRPLFIQENIDEDIKRGYEEVPGKFALTRDSDNRVLDIVGSQYTPIQNHEAFKFFKEFVEAGSAHLETAGSLRGGQMVWGLANLNASFKLRGNDEVKGYLLVVAPHMAGKSFITKFTTVRVVCNNTLTLALRNSSGGEFRMAHRSSLTDTVIERAKETLGIAREQVSEFEATAKKLQKLKFTRYEVAELLAPVFQPSLEDFKDDSLWSPKMKVLMDALVHAPGAQPDNGWGILNAASYYSSHIASRTADKRLTNAWMGRTGVQVEKVLESLLKIA